MERVNHPHFQKIKKAIETNNHAQIFTASTSVIQNTPEDFEGKLCLIVSAIKTENYKHLQNTVFKNPPTLKEPEEVHLFYGYFLYLQNDYQRAVKHLLELKQTNRVKILLSQIYFKALNYEKSFECLSQVINANKKADQIDQYLVNLLSCAYRGATCNENIRRIVEQIKGKNIQVINNKDLVFNMALFWQIIGNASVSRQFIVKYLTLLNQVQDKQDVLAVRLIQDYISNYYSPIQVMQNLDKKIEDYEKYQQLENRDKNLKVVIENNLLALKQLRSDENHHEQIKRFDELINGKYKQTRTQLLLLKINRLILQLQKNRYIEANKSLKDLDASFSSAQLLAVDAYIKCKVYLFTKQKEEKELEILFSDYKFTNPFLKFYLRIEYLKERQNVSQIFKEYKEMAKSNQDISNNEVINKYIFSVILKDEVLFEKELESINKIIATTGDIRILKILKEIFNKKGQTQKEKVILEKILKINPKDSLAKLSLAKIKLSDGDLLAAEELMKGLQKPDEIVDMDYLQTLENNIHISTAKPADVKKPQTLVKLKKKIKKHKKRFPKNFDPKNPGPAPNPERWLPKYERKDFKKKKNYKSGRTQGFANVGKETLNTFTNANTTSNIDVNKAKAKKTKR